jgi:hypothetical protein
MAETNGRMITHAESGRAWLWPLIEFKSGELVSATKWIRILPVVGGVLAVPQSMCAVLTFRRGRRKVFTEGIHWLNHGCPMGLYPVKYVSAKVHRTPIPFVEAMCQDGWRAGLALEILWQVRDAAFIVDVAGPVGDFVAAVKAGVRAVIETMEHDALIGGGSVSAIDSVALAADIAIRLADNPAIRGIKVLKILITDRQGDERRIQIAQENAVERTRVVKEQELRRQQISSEAALVSQQKDLEIKRRDLVLTKAQTERRRIEEERKVRIGEAGIEAEVARQLLPTQWQQVRLGLAADTIRQRHEQTLRMIDAYSQILGDVAKLWQFEAFGVSPRRRPEAGFDGLETAVIHGLDRLNGLLQSPMLVPGPEPMPYIDGKTPFQLPHIATQVVEIADMDGVRECNLGINGKEGEYRVQVQLRGRILDIICRPGHPGVASEIWWDDSDNGRQRVPFAWSDAMSLKHILQMFQTAADDQLLEANQ